MLEETWLPSVADSALAEYQGQNQTGPPPALIMNDCSTGEINAPCWPSAFATLATVRDAAI